MKRNRHLGLAVLLIFFGTLIFANKFGFHFGPVMGYVFPLILIGLGVVGFKNGRKVIGAVMGTIGALILIGKLSSLIGFVVAGAMIWYGIVLLRRKSHSY